MPRWYSQKYADMDNATHVMSGDDGRHYPIVNGVVELPLNNAHPGIGTWVPYTGQVYADPERLRPLTTPEEVSAYHDAGPMAGGRIKIAPRDPDLDVLIAAFSAAPPDRRAELLAQIAQAAAPTPDDKPPKDRK